MTDVQDTNALRELVLAAIAQSSTLDKVQSKDAYRSLHTPAVSQQLGLHQQWIQRNWDKHEKYFANGADVIPKDIAPRLVEVTEGWQADVFRLARLTWSLPFTKGYGRRLRFLIMDESNKKLIGILGLQSPPLDFPARDRLFLYPRDRKPALVNQTMDIFALGAVPPYNRLLGGKLVALSAAANEVRSAYLAKYQDRVTILDKHVLPAELVALTTTSAFGRSSIYNRLKFQERAIAESIGYTMGYGSFHLAPIYSILRDFAVSQGVSVKGGFGVGPRIVWQTCSRVFDKLGLPRRLLQHGLKREVFLFSLISNLEDYMKGADPCPLYYNQPFDELAQWWHKRWLHPRSERVDGWHTWDKQQLREVITLRDRVEASDDGG